MIIRKRILLIRVPFAGEHRGGGGGGGGGGGEGPSFCTKFID